MKTKLRFWFYPFILMGIVLFFANSCKKDDLKIDPVISWENPADITYITVLSNLQLNATSVVSGIFVYTPSIGTKLNEGANQDLRVDFSPDDSVTYNKASKTVKINVTASSIVTDLDGNKYKTVIIGTQEWMSENLKTTKYNDGSAISNVPDNTQWENLRTGAYCNYDNLENNGISYGRLYNWYAINTGILAPEGWHVPTDDEWTQLKKYLIANGYNYDGTNIKNRVAKSLASQSGWKFSNISGTVGTVPETNNKSGFAALPGGYRVHGNFVCIGEYGVWWSSTEIDFYFALYWNIGYSNSGFSGYSDHHKVDGFSIRCVRN